MKVLVVDDSRAIRRIIGDIMKKIGFEVIEAGNGIEALQRLDEIGEPDLVLLDSNMPKMNGMDLVRAIRANPTFSNLPIIMVTTETEMEQMALAMMGGINEFVMKPFDQATIADKLQLLGIGV